MVDAYIALVCQSRYDIKDKTYPQHKQEDNHEPVQHPRRSLPQSTRKKLIQDGNSRKQDKKSTKEGQVLKRTAGKAVKRIAEIWKAANDQHGTGKHP